MERISAKGVRHPLADLLIAGTALELDYGVAIAKSPALPEDPRPDGRAVVGGKSCNQFAIT